MSPDAPWAGRRIHFVGVGGAGMSGYARAAHALGATVTGSDRAEGAVGSYLARLRQEAVLDAAIGHDATNVPPGEDVELYYSSAIPRDNPERVAARERGLAERPRAELLAELSALRRTIAVAGAHGKTTTSAMIAQILRGQAFDPSWLVGSSIGPGLANSHWSKGEWLVVEADESDRSMLSLNVEIAVLTNVELDHHTTFASLAELREAFATFLARASRAVVVWNRPDLLALAPSGPKLVPYDPPVPLDEAGLRGGFATSGADPSFAPSSAFGSNSSAGDAGPGVGGVSFSWRGQQVRLGVPGAHNALNAVAALEACRLVGADERSAPRWLAAFSGAGRRFQRVGTTSAGATVIDDYAHHPTEVSATLQAAATLAPRRLVAVFQPHLYSRTALLAREFGESLARADVVAVLDVYPARERPEAFPGVTGLTIARAAAERAGGRPVLWLPDFAAARRALRLVLREGDLCVVMGAGDSDVLARELVA